MQRYNPKDIEPKWQQKWEETGLYTTDFASSKPPYMAMSMFNYPSGAGIHIGHAMNYTISDVKARFKRQQGYESYHPIGWDAFGLPAENYAIKAGVSPQKSMATIIPSYHKQYKAMGWSNDWSKEIATHTPEYYKWTQWIFAQMYKNGLVYQDSRMQWWCEKCQTVLANEQVVDGKCWRHDGPDDKIVEKREVKQWFFKITEYADELLDAIDDLDWTESVKLAQKNWIGRSRGAEVRFAIDDTSHTIDVFTTRPDTLFGVTFLVLAPEHELATAITTSGQKDAVEAYIRATQKLSDVERLARKQKTGVFTGSYAVNPVSGQKIPVWLADYVLTGYGTGAIMAVPAHDERDYAFATAFGLPVTPVVAPLHIRAGDIHEWKNAVDRNVAVAVAHNPADDTYCMIRWADAHSRAGLEWPGGGIDDGESVAEGALREFVEETGYTDVTVERVLPVAVTFYYIDGQGSPRRAVKNIVTLTVNSTAHNGIVGTEDYEKEAYKVEWLTKAQILGKISEMSGDFGSVTNFVFDQEIFTGEGVMVNSGEYDGMTSSDAREKIVLDLALKGVGTEKVNYKMRDWSVSRQRYWGAPIPIINCEKCGPVLVDDNSLPVVLPELTDFQPSGDGRSALARATEWLKVDCPQCGGIAERETDTLDTYIDSSWYMFRYLDPHNSDRIFDTATVNKWMPVDFYNGGDHATAHLLYARFIARFFTKIGIADNPEPFKQMLFNGKVTASDGSVFSKSKGNGIDPLEIIDSGYGADALRMYLMFAAPLEFSARWDPQGVPGTHRFLSRLWNLVQEYLAVAEGGNMDSAVAKKIERASHHMIQKMTHDIEQSTYNTAIATAMGTLNELYKLKSEIAKHPAWQHALESLVACVAPFAPHITEELWSRLGRETSVHIDSWPEWDADKLTADMLTVVIQINGKLRGELPLAPDMPEAAVVQAARTHKKIAPYLDGKEIRKTVYIPGRIVNFVV